MATQLPKPLEVDQPTTQRHVGRIDKPSTGPTAGGLTRGQPVLLTRRKRTGPKFKSTRATRIRYDLKSVMRQRARHQQRERERAKRGTIVIGRFILAADTVALEAIQWETAFHIATPPNLTRAFSHFARWNTRQAANQWLDRHPDPCLQPVNLKTLRGKQDPTGS